MTRFSGTPRQKMPHNTVATIQWTVDVIVTRVCCVSYTIYLLQLASGIVIYLTLLNSLDVLVNIRAT